MCRLRETTLLLSINFDATMVTSAADTTLVVMDHIDPVVQLAAISQPLSQAGPSRFVVATHGECFKTTTLSLLLEIRLCRTSLLLLHLPI